MMNPHEIMPQSDAPWDPAAVRALIAAAQQRAYPTQAPAEVTAGAKTLAEQRDMMAQPMYLAPGVLGGYQHGMRGNVSIAAHDNAFQHPGRPAWANVLTTLFGAR